MSTARKRLGFTIIEALVAIVLTGIGVVAALEGLSALTKSQATTSDKERMSRLAVLKYEELSATADLLNIGGTFEDIGEDRFVWEAAVSSTTETDLSELTVTVTKINSSDASTGQSVSGLVYVEPQSTTGSGGTGTTGAAGATGATGTTGGGP